MFSNNSLKSYYYTKIYSYKDCSSGNRKLHIRKLRSKIREDTLTILFLRNLHRSQKQAKNGTTIEKALFDKTEVNGSTCLVPMTSESAKLAI